MAKIEIKIPEPPQITYNTNPLQIPCCQVVEVELTNSSGNYYGILAGGADSRGKYINVFGVGHNTIMHVMLNEIRKWRLAPAGITINITT